MVWHFSVQARGGVSWYNADMFKNTRMLSAAAAALCAAGLCGCRARVSCAERHADVARGELERIYETVKTPFKHGVVIAPERGQMVDSPCVFRFGGKWLMSYIVFDGKGYETHLAESDDLVRWTKRGRVFSKGAPGAWDSAQSDGCPQLLDTAWGGSYELSRHDGRYWMTYIGGALDGYETDPLAIGVAWTDDAPDTAEWKRLPRPVLACSDADARPFEGKTLYRSFVVADRSRSLGAKYVMFYNAKQRGPWIERIGMAASDDMVRWRRVGDGAAIDDSAGRDFAISGDPMVQRIGDLWVMFYFGCGWRDGAKGAFDTFAVSRDLVHWTKWDGPALVEPSEGWDAEHAHKPWVVFHGGTVYHFYCAVGNRGRCIALAASRPLHERQK